MTDISGYMNHSAQSLTFDHEQVVTAGLCLGALAIQLYIYLTVRRPYQEEKQNKRRFQMTPDTYTSLEVGWTA